MRKNRNISWVGVATCLNSIALGELNLEIIMRASEFIFSQTRFFSSKSFFRSISVLRASFWGVKRQSVVSTIFPKCMSVCSWSMTLVAEVIKTSLSECRASAFYVSLWGTRYVFTIRASISAEIYATVICAGIKETRRYAIHAIRGKIIRRTVVGWTIARVAFLKYRTAGYFYQEVIILREQVCIKACKYRNSNQCK